MSDGIIVIRKGREKPIIQQHPWIFSGAIEAVRGNPTPGDIVTVTDYKGAFLARGYWNPKSQIQVRILTWQDEPINDDWWRRMLKRAITGRFTTHDPSESLRLINAENDYIPGLILDRYWNVEGGAWYVLQSLTLGIERRKEEIVKWLIEEARDTDDSPLNGIYERSDVDVRQKEGLQSSTGLLYGTEPLEHLEISENPVRIKIDIRKGHKTGFYLDQSQNRQILHHLAFTHNTRLLPGGYIDDSFPPQTSLLNLFSFTGGFGLHYLSGGAKQVINVDASRDALELAEENVILNRFQPERAEFIQADVFDYLHDQVAEGAQYDVIVCDPPKFAHNAGQVERAARGYKDLNLNCFKLVKPGGYLMTFSCSGAIDADLFQKIVFGALVDSGRQAQIVKHLTQAEDHPVALTFPEGAYLKGLLLRVY